MKWIGALAILLASGLAALIRLRWQREEASRLRSLMQSLRFLERGLSERQESLADLFRTLTEGTCPAVRTFYSQLFDSIPRLGEESFSSVWRRAVQNCFGDMQSGWRAQFAALGDELGGSELDTQIRALRGLSEELERRADESEQRWSERRKPTLGIALALGAFVVILLS